MSHSEEQKEHVFCTQEANSVMYPHLCICVFISQIYLGTSFARSLLQKVWILSGGVRLVPVSSPVSSSTPYLSLLFFVQFLSNIHAPTQLVGEKVRSPGAVGCVSQLFEAEKVSDFSRLL